MRTMGDELSFPLQKGQVSFCLSLLLGNILLGDCNYSPIPLHHPPRRILYHNPGRHQHLRT